MKLSLSPAPRPQQGHVTVAPPVVRSLSDQVYDWLKERIFTGDLRADQRLDIDTLAGQIRVSRTPLRDAVNRLALEGLVAISPRRGTRVSALTISEVETIFEARALIEPPVCAAAAAVVSDVLLEELGAIQDEWEGIDPAEVYKDYGLHNRYAELDAAFHLGIVGALRNPRLDKIIAALNIQRRVAPLVFDSEYRGPVRRIGEHRTILRALSTREGRAAEQAVRHHIENARQDLIEFLAQNERSAGRTENIHLGAG